jgi:hypothetical protein
VSQKYFPAESLFCKIKTIWFRALNCIVAFLMAIDAGLQNSFIIIILWSS